MIRRKLRNPGRLPQPQRLALARAQRVEWVALALRVSVVIALYAVLGGTQTLTAIWLKSVWSLWPPIAFLIACRVERWPPRPRFPYGFYRAGTIAFLSAALALSVMGLYLLYAGAQGLLAANHPQLEPIRHSDPVRQWPGWLMIAALIYSILVPLMLGRRRRQLALALYDKGLYADAMMGRASWLAGSAAIVGVLGIGVGLWWADFAATLMVGADILRHGARHLYTALCDLTDEVPRKLGTRQVDPLGVTIHDYLQTLDWVADARVRLRTEGRRLTGIGFVCPHVASDNLIARLDQARLEVESLDWRLLGFELIPTDPRRCACGPRAPI